ncbi:MAG: hypothetical protein VX617_08020, partial [Pseudomonadota bacterium]|nr:hypothetical protein [Pseudomonadota bacterium]
QTIHPEILYPVQLIFTISAFFLLRKYKLLPEARSHVFIGALIWVALASISYWIVGPYSYSAVQTELDFSVPIHQYYASLPSGTLFAHEFAGGVDAFAINQFTGQYVSLERILVSSFPTWLGIAFHKVLLFSVGFAGAYILCRRLTKCDRQLAFAAGAAYSLASDALTIHSFWHGLAIGLLPLAVYLMVARQGRKNYYIGVTLFGAFYATTTTVPVAVLSFFFTLPLVALMIGGVWGFLRGLPGLIIVLVLILLNWHESMFAMAQISQFTLRQFAIAGATDPSDLFNAFWVIQKNVYMDSNLVIAVALAAVVFLIAYKKQNLFQGIYYATVFSLFGFYIFLISVFPWSWLGMDLVNGLTFNYARHGLPTIMILLLASAGAYDFGKGKERLASGAFPAVIFSLAIGKLAYYKAYEPLTWLSGGGLSVYNLESLKSPSWEPNEPFRVAAVPFRLPDNALPTLGFHSATAIFSLQIASSAKYWSAVENKPLISKEDYFTTGPSLYTRLGQSVATCCTEYDIEKFGINSNLLKIANIRFIISRNPLVGAGLRKVDGPPDGTMLPRDNTPVREKLARYVRWIQNPDQPYVYELPNPTPRIFAAKYIIELQDDLSTKKFFEELTKAAPKRNAVLTRNALRSLGSYGAGLKIEEFMVVKNGFDVIVEKGTSGVLVVNVPYLPFWKARSKGIELPVAPANEIHMAVNIPDSAELISIRYERPLFRETFFNFLNNTWNKIFISESVEQYAG